MKLTDPDTILKSGDEVHYANGEVMVIYALEGVSIDELQGRIDYILRTDPAPDLAEHVRILRHALKTLADCSQCQNGCDPNDMTCASNLASAALAQTEDK
jgi:hypothetical protein